MLQSLKPAHEAPASAKRCTAERLSALSPVIGHEEHSPARQLDSIATHAMEQSASSPVSHQDIIKIADASPYIEHDGGSSVSQTDTKDAVASPGQTGMCWLHTYYGVLVECMHNKLRIACSSCSCRLGVVPELLYWFRRAEHSWRCRWRSTNSSSLVFVLDLAFRFYGRLSMAPDKLRV